MPTELTAIDARVQAEIDEATDVAETSPPPRRWTRSKACTPIRRGCRRSGTARACGSAVEKHERPSSWGTHDG